MTGSGINVEGRLVNQRGGRRRCRRRSP